MSIEKYNVVLIEVVKTLYVVEASSHEEAIEKAQVGDYEQCYGIEIVDHLNTQYGSGEAFL